MTKIPSLSRGGTRVGMGYFQVNKEHLIDVYKSAIRAADPFKAVTQKLRVSGSRMTLEGKDYNLREFNRIVVVGAGKAVAPMARAVEEIFGDSIDDGIIIVKYGHTGSLRKIRQIEASHPLPDLNGVRGTNDVMDMLKRVDENTLIICLISGGASSLLVSPVNGLSLEDKRVVTEILLKAGGAAAA